MENLKTLEVRLENIDTQIAKLNLRKYEDNIKYSELVEQANKVKKQILRIQLFGE